MSPLTESTRLVLKKPTGSGWTITPQTKVPVDPFRSQVSLLLHGDGANGSTTITDSSPTPKPVPVVANAQISTAQSKFGGASIAFDGAGDYLQLAGQVDFAFGTGNFTIETWVRFNNINKNQQLINFNDNSIAPRVELFVNSSNNVGVYNNGTQRIISTSSVSANTWYHIALARNGADTKLFIDGVQAGSTYSDSSNYTVAAGRPVIGILGFNLIDQSLDGYIDDLRITKGVARYTANFTPPAAPFPDI
jgi:hypothetical protein